MMLFRLLEAKRNGAAIQLIDTLLTELKRLDDKLVLTEVHLLESRVYRNIENLPKSKVPISSVFGIIVNILTTFGRLP